MEKLAFALVTTTRKLRPYFQAHPVIVLMDKPLKRAMSSSEATRWMTLWAIELNKYDILYRPCTAVKRQVIADFIVEFTNMEGQGAKECLRWTIYTDHPLDW